MVGAERPSVSNYLDFRAFLRDFYSFKRATEKLGRRSYNYSSFAAAADIKSPNYLKLIIEGQRNLSDKMVKKFAKALGLDRDETHEFGLLVAYGQETDPQDRSRHLQKLSEYRFSRNQNGENVPSWITWVVHQMANQDSVELGNIDQVCEAIKARPKKKFVEEAIFELLETGVLEKDQETGTITKSKSRQASSREIPFDVIRKIQTELVYLGLESLFKDSSEEREVGGATLSLTQEEFDKLRFELRKLRKAYQRDFEAKRENEKGDRVYQLNIQLFPLTESVSERKTGPNKLAPRERGERGETGNSPIRTPEPQLDL